MGIPAIQYLSNWRLQLAAGLLDRQGMSIAQIAADVASVPKRRSTARSRDRWECRPAPGACAAAAT